MDSFIPLMPLLKGGRNYRLGNVAGKPFEKWERTSSKRIISRSVVTHLGNVILKKGQKIKKITLVAKHFLPRGKKKGPRQFRPLHLLERYHALRILNQDHHLGLRLPTTVRIMEETGMKPRLVQTHYAHEMREEELSHTQNMEYSHDMEWQMQRLLDNGLNASDGAFIPVHNTETGKIMAILYHFEQVTALKKKFKF